METGQNENSHAHLRLTFMHVSKSCPTVPYQTPLHSGSLYIALQGVSPIWKLNRPSPVNSIVYKNAWRDYRRLLTFF